MFLGCFCILSYSGTRVSSLQRETAAGRVEFAAGITSLSDIEYLLEVLVVFQLQTMRRHCFLFLLLALRAVSILLTLRAMSTLCCWTCLIEQQ